MSADSELQLVHIGLGGNVGDVENAFKDALDALDAHSHISVLEKSNLYKTPPWGDENQDWFLNACASLETTLDPLELLDFMKSIEQKLKREKTRRWGPRTIDLDILTYGQKIYHSERVTIPHPRMHERGFVLQPLADIAPDLMVNGLTISAWLSHTDTSEIEQAKRADQW